jgi:hypothetical protein
MTFGMMETDRKYRRDSLKDQVTQDSIAEAIKYEEAVKDIQEPNAQTEKRSDQQNLNLNEVKLTTQGDRKTNYGPSH